MKKSIEEFLVGKIYYDGAVYCYLDSIWDITESRFVERNSTNIETFKKPITGPIRTKYSTAYPNLKTVLDYIKEIKCDLNTILLIELVNLYPEYII